MASEYDKPSDDTLKIRTLLQKPDSETATASSSEANPSDMLTFLPASDIGVPKNETGETLGRRLQTQLNRISNSLTALGRRIRSTSNAGLLVFQRHVNRIAALVALIPIPKITIKPTVYQCSSWIELFEHIPANTNILTPWLGKLKTRLLPTIISYVNYMKVIATALTSKRISKRVSKRILNVSRLLEDQNNRRLLDLTSIFLTVVLLILLWAGRTQLGI